MRYKALFVSKTFLSKISIESLEERGGGMSEIFWIHRRADFWEAK